ncbi:MAG: helix-turn-helix transcriptional regulator [Devosia nanyangense]|uniref:Helix-turn-helix transcriptional regulator n=1 Tax=Devosia nanyangense TaxID=1228055 RepID=A0A933NX99_9HYPH|nr:helix-turn-helix transcriptional regulator [Devosia nanyangense]
MAYEIAPRSLELRDHRFGRINRRMPIGPVRWPFHDLFWLHEGKATIRFPELSARLDLVAPAGVLIRPGTLFSGAPVGAFATASICHFVLGGDTSAAAPGYLLPNADEALHIQHLLRLCMHLARRNRPDELPRRQRLLAATLDGFHAPGETSNAAADEDRLASAWSQAGQNLHRMRTLSDVAALLGVSESALRAMHRRAWDTSAGERLRDLRLTRAEELLVATGLSLSEIARAVGYGHAATLSAAFRRRRGKTPGQYRRWSNPFA